MKICINCNFVSDGERCPVCGGKNLRAVQEDDFCLLTEKDAAYCDILTGIFDEKSIAYSAMPYGRGIETQFGLPLNNYRIFVPFGSLEEAKGIMCKIESAETEKLRGYLLDGVEMLNVSPRAERKIRKKIKLSDDTDSFEYCIDMIKAADRIADGGMITGCLKGGHYYFCYAGKATLTINSQTFEILSLTL